MDPARLLPDRRRVRRRYDRAAAGYAAHARVEAELARRLMECTEFMSLSPERVLDIGCGPGSAFDALARRFPGAELLAVDISVPMLREARRVPGTGVAVAVADAESLPFADGCVGVCWSSACLHLVDHARMFREAHRVLVDEGLLVFSTFGPDTLREVRAAFLGIDGHPHTGHFIDMHDLGDALRRCGFVDPVMEREELVLTYAHPLDVVRDLRASGAANVAAGARPTLMGKGDWRRFLGRYGGQGAAADGRVTATFELILGHAWCKRGGQREDGTRPVGFHPRAGLAGPGWPRA